MCDVVMVPSARDRSELAVLNNVRSVVGESPPDAALGVRYKGVVGDASGSDSKAKHEKNQTCKNFFWGC
jgi:hypothetical protein